MAPSSNPPPLRIAILGGGLAGGAAFRVLSKNENLVVDIFESAPAFREQGQGVGMNPNAMAALEMLGLLNCLQDAGAVRAPTCRMQIGGGPDAGTFLFDLDLKETGTHNVHRTPFLSQLYKGMDETRMHVNKKMVRIEEKGEEVVLHFQDGTTHVCDILLGADGIRSDTRKYVLGENDPAAEPSFAGWYAVWTCAPIEEAVKHLGSDLVNIEDTVQYMWFGPDSLVLHNILSNTKQAQCVLCERVPEDKAAEWKKTVSKDHLRKLLSTHDSRFHQGIVEMATRETGDETPMLAFWHHREHARTIVKGPIALLGDAAGTAVPFKGAACGMAMEDVLILSELFKVAKTPKEARIALTGYDRVNKPRRQRLVDSSYEVGLLMSLCHPEAGRNIEEIKKRLEHRWDWLLNVDLQKNVDTALEVLQQDKR